MKNKNKFPNTHRAVSPRPAKKRTRVVSETLWKTTEYFCESAVIFFEPFSSTNSQMYYTNFRRINCLSLACHLLKRINNSWREHKGNHYREEGLDMLWCNFVLGANIIFLCLKLIIIHYHSFPYPKTKENNICTKDKIAPQQIPGLNLHRFWRFYSFVFSAFNDQFEKLYQTLETVFH